MTERQYVRGHIERGDGQDSPIRFVAATEGRKADGLDLRMERLDLDRFTANPIIGYGHDYYGRGELPIGRATDMKVDSGRLLATVEFDQGDQFATEVERKVRGGFLNSVSVGFAAKSVDRDGAPESWELHEISVVPIPLDPAATAEQRSDDDANPAGRLQELLITRLASRAFDDLIHEDEPVSGERGAIGSHSTATTEGKWDGPAAVSAAGNDKASLRHMHAWVDGDGERPEDKSSYKLPHHAAGADTAANLTGVRNALARLPQSDIPEADHARVRAHLQRHLDDAERTVTNAKLRLHLAEQQL
jgi:hypothetical protein